MAERFGSRALGGLVYAAVFIKRKAAYHVTRLLLSRWDRVHHVETGGWIELSDAASSEFRGGYDVVSTPPSVFRHVSRFFPAACDRYTYVDMGSGKGRTVLLASELGFKRAIGVDLATFACDIARENIRSYRSAVPRRSVCEIVNADATHYELPEGDLVLFFNNPFGPDVWSAMARKIAAIAGERRALKIVMIGSFPDSIRTAAALLVQTGQLGMEAEGVTPRFLDSYARFHYVVLSRPA